jgi:D-lactate dehydrogenase (cytochrome)
MSHGDTVKACTPEQIDQAFAQLRERLGERASRGESVRANHGRDESWHPPQLPDAVVFPHSTEEVSAIARICHAHRVPMIPFGAGSSVEGALIPTHGGVVIDMTQMDKLLAVHAGNFDCVVQPGLHRRALNDLIKDTGLFFSVDPGADATIGGMTSTRASGTNTVRYGTMADMVRGLEVVLADGRIIRTGNRARKSAAGYDLTHLFVGSEGTLGIVTEITLRLYPRPEHVVSATCQFPSVDAAVDCAVAIMQAGVGIARVELLDEVMIDAVNKYSKLSMPVTPHLFFEFHGSESQTQYTTEVVQELSADFGGQAFECAVQTEERNKLWRARHDCAYACMAYERPKKLMTTDVCVPLDSLSECIAEARRDAKQAGITAPVLGHVGDGNFHMVLIIDPDNADEVQRAEEVNHRLVSRAIACGGTCTGEHGVGLGKRAYLREEHGLALDVMTGIKASLDPLGLMNPGKVFPD